MSINKNPEEILLYNSLKGLHLLEKTDKQTILENLLGIQCQFSSYAQNSLRIRANDYSDNNWKDDTVKIWSHRGTLHIVNHKDLPLHLAASGYKKDFVDGKWGISKENAEKWAPFIVDEIRKGNTSRDGLKDACTEKGMSESLKERIFYGWGGLIYEMTYRGMIAAVPGNKKEYLIPVIDKPLSEKDKAREMMVRKYFKHFGPATPADCRYFFGGWSSSELNLLLQKIIPEMYESTFNGKKYYSVKEPDTDAEIPDCVLVPGFDQLVLGYKDRSRIISENNTRKLTNISGIVFPSVIIRNKIRARWKVDKGTVSIIPFEKLYKKDEMSVKRKIYSVFGKETHVLFESG